MRVGVTGHRWNRIDPKVEGPLLASLLQEVMSALPFASGPVTLVTGMAEGTDLTAASVRPAHWTLEAALALPEPGWRTHLDTASGVRPEDRIAFAQLISGATVIVPGTKAPEPDYVALAAYLASTCTSLLAVWDGEPGPPGGTSDVVSRALERGVPVVNIWPRLAASRQHI